MSELQLLPRPRELEQTGARLTLSNGVIQLASCPQELLFSAGTLEAAAASLGLTLRPSAAPGDGGVIVLAVDPEAMPHDQGYILEIDSEAARITGHDPAGVFYGAVTLRQLMANCGAELPELRIQDWPDFPARGVMLDISRDKVPTLDTLKSLVDKLAAVKLNQLQLYIEHTFAYPGHEVVWEKASPVTPAEILELDAYCRERFVELAPNQNSFGHLARWFKHKEYLHLAETAEGSEIHGRHLEPFSLCPTDPASIEFIKGLYGDFLPNFSSKLFNVGCDETWDVGQGRSKEICAEKGTTEVYLEFLLRIYELCRQHGRTMMFWGDIINRKPELISQLPRDVIALEWGYEASHPFDENGANFAASGIPFYVCPGTSSWNSVLGRTDNAIGNLLNAAENGLKHGACGYLITDWGDSGHWQYLPVSYLGFAWGAAYSWALASNREQDLAPALSLNLFQDPTGNTGKAAYKLGNNYKSGVICSNGSTLFHVLQTPLGQLQPAIELTQEGLDAARAHIHSGLELLAAGKSTAEDAELVKAEFRHNAEMLFHAIRLVLFKKKVAECGENNLAGLKASATELAAEMETLIARHRELWLARNRDGGLVDSAARFEARLDEYRNFPASAETG